MAINRHGFANSTSFCSSFFFFLPLSVSGMDILAKGTKVTKLKNGVRVASHAVNGHFVSAGVFLDAGSRFESPETQGCAHFMDRMTFKVYYF